MKERFTFTSLLVFRFYTDNPGYWLIHCHISFDLIEGQVCVKMCSLLKSHLQMITRSWL